ncbi:MAG: hypothetical protein IIZ93_14185 [Acidaminococcaceae bacterium]|nr:hypothetical protein [Acidaminococcaceae bacterium]
MKCPCKGCEKVGCGSFHDRCEAYQAWTAENARASEKRAAEVDMRNLSRDHEMKYRRNLKGGWR